MFVNGQRRETVFHDAQQPNGDFVNQWYADDAGGDLHKLQLGFEFGDQATGANDAGYAVVGADLNRYVTTGGVKKQARYRATLPRRSSSVQEINDYTNIFNLVEVAMTNAPIGSDAYTVAQVSAVDVEEWFKIHVTQHLYNNGDSFSYGGGQNAFLYKPERDTWKLLLWDVDFAFGGAANDSNLTGIGGQEHGPRNNHPPFERIYWQALIEAANGMLTAARSNPILDARYSGMASAGAGVASAQGIKDFIAARRTLVLSQIAANQSSFAVTSNGGADFITNRNLITLTGTAPLEVRTLLVNGVPYPVTWTTRSTWVIRVPLHSGTNALVITGVDPKGVPVAGVSATMRVNYTGADELPQDKIVINEIMYHPLVADSGYVEFYNTSVSNAFDMSGWRLNGADFVFPNGTVLEPGTFKLAVKEPVIYAQTFGPSSAIAGQFKGNLDHGGETLTLIKPGPTPDQDVIVNRVTYDDVLPWPVAADGQGASLQLIDPLQDNSRAANWAAIAVGTNSLLPPPQWQYVTASGNATTARLYVYLQSAGDVYVDDIQVVPGSVAEVGVNSVQNGDFESAFPGAWTVSPNLTASAVSTAVKHSGAASLHVISSAPGTTQGSSIWQDLSPALVVGQPYTLSFWYFQSSNGGPFTIRLSGSGITTAVNIAPPGASNAVRYTPGLVNNVRAALPAFPALWLNEVLPNNFFLGANGIMDRFGDRDPWVELYNGGANSISLNGYYLANNYTNLTQWPFPPGTVIGPHQFLLVWLDGEPAESLPSELHASFRVAPDIGSVVLATGTNLSSVVDHLNYNIPVAGRSYGSYPEGTSSGRRLFATVTPGGANNPASPPVDVRINEWMADNQAALADTDGNYEDWFEIYNPGSDPADLSGSFLTDDLSVPMLWPIPPGTIIPGHGYLLVWADGEPDQNGPGSPDLHAAFSLSKSGEAIGLFAADGTLIDAVQFGLQFTDVSQGRYPDGAAEFFSFSNSTPRTANIIAAPNAPPDLGFIPDKTVDEGSVLSFTCAASDTNVPAQTLTYSLDPGAPAGVTVNPASGLFRWVPTEDQGPGFYAVTVRVTDSGTPRLSATATFHVTVNEVNNPPVLAAPLSRTIPEGVALSVTNSATDPDAGPQTLRFSLDPGAPAGMAIQPTTGLISWTPTEAQGPGTYAIHVRVTDNGVPPLSDMQTLTVFVVEVNTPPELAFIPDRIVGVDEPVTFTALGADVDVPVQTLTYSLGAGAPVDAVLDPNTGVFSWTPGAASAGTTNQITITADDHGSPAFTASRTFSIVVSTDLRAEIQRAAETVTISFRTTAGGMYRVEYQDLLGGGSWSQLGTNTPALGSSLNFQDATTNGLQRFYRVRKVD
jgi:hypothetical protein